MAADWSWVRRAWEKWATKHVGPSGLPSRLSPLRFIKLPVSPDLAEQEGTQLTAVDMRPLLDFVKRGNLQTEFFSIKPNQCECLTC
ncbi:hypothetical protein BAE44_0012656 [Dichanthelium oligosanthes]|uniref:Uncharacterized protein n=1 Tax=Dichanthelium oligosanthes TaxID=888268 RepID=A0A1E5VMI2_9POAL|nr:hypothetical protein BAE44_0012656 [Dichanthelium oligosanthes]